MRLNIKLVPLTTLLLAGSIGCNPALPEEQVTDEATAALVTNDQDNGNVAADAQGGMGDGDVAEGADEMATSAADTEPAVASASYDPCDFAARRQHVLAEYDHNNDGHLDRTEIAALKGDLGDGIGARFGGRLLGLFHFARVAAWHRVRWAFDENNDGVLSADERAQLIDALESRCRVVRQRVLDKFDADHDGTLSDAELAAARAALRAKLIAERAVLLAKYDLDGNGVLDLSERQAIKADVVAKLRALRQAVIAKFDLNKNGTLDPDEQAALKAAVRDRISDAGEPDTAPAS